MGCNQSTANDVTESRQRVPVDTHASSPPSGPVGLDKAPSRAIATNINTRPGPRPDEAKLSQSASNRAENANDTFFKALIERTANNFIDVAQNTAPLEGRDAADRAQEYRERIRSAVVPAKPLTVFALPEPSRSNPSPVALLKSTPITKEDVEFVQRCSQTVAAGYHAMAVRDCGELVVTFPAFSMS